jgi:hypothetical protein
MHKKLQRFLPLWMMSKKSEIILCKDLKLAKSNLALALNKMRQSLFIIFKCVIDRYGAFNNCVA